MDQLLPILDEQVAVKFTGRVNVMDKNTKQLFGNLILIDGELVEANYKKMSGLKAFFSMYLDEFENLPLIYITEPEIISHFKHNIPYPYQILKQRLSQIVEKYAASRSNKPPLNLKLMLNPEFILKGEEINSTEFKVMGTISDYNLVKDIYQNSTLLDFEITTSLVSLRKKGALKVIKQVKG